MKIRLTPVFLLFPLFLAGTAFAQQDGPALEGPQEEVDAIFALLGEWSTARDAGNVDGVVAVHHPDIVIMTRGRAILEGADGVRTFYAENYGEGSSRQQFGELNELRVFGDVAMMTGTFLVIDETKGVEDPGYYLIVLRKDDEGKWRIYRDIDTPSPDGLTLKPVE